MRSGSVEVEYLTGPSLEDVLKAVAALPARTVVLVGPYLRDVTGRDFVKPEAIGRIAASSSVPTYGVMDSAVGSRRRRRACGELRGSWPHRGGPGAPRPGGRAAATDGGEHHRPHGRRTPARALALDARRLPAGTVVRFREPTLWERHRWEIIVVLSVLAGQTLVVAALLFERRRRQRAAGGARGPPALRDAADRDLRRLRCPAGRCAERA